jgi:protein SCO1/2
VSNHRLRPWGLIPGSVAFLALAGVGAPAAAGDSGHPSDTGQPDLHAPHVHDPAGGGGHGGSDAEPAHHAGEHVHHGTYGDHAGELQRSLVSYAIPDVTLRDQRGRAVPLRELLDTDAPILLNFIFTTCTAICPAMSATFARVQHDLGSDSGRVRMLSVSIDPEQDTPPELAAYAERFRAGPQWWFLTGTLEESVAVQRAFDAYRGDKSAHAALTLLRPAQGAQWIRYQGFATASELLEAVRAPLLEEGAEGVRP